MNLESEQNLQLGKKSDYEAHYNPDLLFPIPRAIKRSEIGIAAGQVPFWGYDSWNHYEVSWLNPKGKPMVAMAQVIYDCHSPNIVESKSLKLYFNSLNNSHFASVSEVEETIKKDLSECVQADIMIRINQLGKSPATPIQDAFPGICLDHLDIECSEYNVNPNFLTTHPEFVEESLYSDLLKSNCLVTFQPDWGSVLIQYKGPRIDREGLLKYIVSFRNHNEFHEQCIERIFMDLMHQCKLEELIVHGRYTRRGGLDINPYRSSLKTKFPNKDIRLSRQ